MKTTSPSAHTRSGEALYEVRFLNPGELTAWVDDLARRQRLAAPRAANGVSRYAPVSSSGEIDWGMTRPLLPAKEHFFPPSERLFTIEPQAEGVALREAWPEPAPILFGVRPCDARGALALDAVFLERPPADTAYQRRWQQIALIGLACKQPGPNCFCERVGGAPDDPTGMDVMVTHVADGYLAQIITEQGKLLMKGHGMWIADLPLKKTETRAGEGSLLLGEEAWRASFGGDRWHAWAEACLSCRACAYACPTCRCFDIRDEALGEPGQYERLRCWDSCMGENYRRMAGGHLPRAEKGERLRNRILCKFYYTLQQTGLDQSAACTGCGRCIEVCPAGVDIIEILEQLHVNG